MQFPLITLSFLVVSTIAKSTFMPTRPPSFPLAVKSPYLSTWFPAGSNGGNGGYLPGQWPSFYTGQTLGWTGLVRVDGHTLAWMGAPKDVSTANQTAAEYTATSSVFTVEADGRVEVRVRFLSPLTPKDYKRQALVFSYVEVEVRTLDGEEHNVQVYTDISAEWVSGDVEATAQWDAGTVDGIAYHKVWKQNQQVFSEVDDRAEWGNIYYATDANDNLTTQSGTDDDVRAAFVQNGKLDDSKDEEFRAINDDWPAFGFARDFGAVGDTPVSTLFTIGLCQDNAIQFLGADGLKTLSSLWRSYFQDELTALSFFHNDFSESSKLSVELDDKILEDSIAAAGEDYAILTMLAARQAFGATQLVGTQEKHFLFLKEISSNGNTQTIDVIYPATPIFYYTNPELVKLLLDPHFENQENGNYPNTYAMHDLGTHYPNATGHTDGKDEPMPIEECSNNIIMVLAYVQRSGDTAYVQQHYPILKQWAEYLVEHSLYPAEQLSTDDFAGHLSNQTNLALKGIVVLEAMSSLSALANATADAQNYTAIAHSYISTWQSLAYQNLSHSILNYGNTSSHGLLYNLFADRLLNMTLVPQAVYDAQSVFYPTIAQKYGVPLDTRSPVNTKLDWEVFCAAVASEETRDMFIEKLAMWVGETTTSKPFTDLYQVSDGGWAPELEFKARPVVGGVFALLVV